MTDPKVDVVRPDAPRDGLSQQGPTPTAKEKFAARFAMRVEHSPEDKWLRAFVRESNRIEGIERDERSGQWDREVAAHVAFLALESVSVANLEVFVDSICGEALRERAGMNVRVGNHRPIHGGMHVRTMLAELLEVVNEKKLSPFEAHVRYETLHPFMDGNGRSGRVLWLWMMRHALGRLQALGFLHTWYYQSLEARQS